MNGQGVNSIQEVAGGEQSCEGPNSRSDCVHCCPGMGLGRPFLPRAGLWLPPDCCMQGSRVGPHTLLA